MRTDEDPDAPGVSEGGGVAAADTAGAGVAISGAGGWSCGEDLADEKTLSREERN